MLTEALSLNKSLKHDTLSENITFVGDPIRQALGGSNFMKNSEYLNFEGE